ncbi:MAG: halocyanin domain-containing protein [Haloarculaceae archaeon]
MSDHDAGVSRRGFLRTATGGAALAATTGAAAAQENGTAAGNATAGNATAGGNATSGGGNATSGGESGGGGGGGGKPDLGGWLDGVSDYDGSVTDKTGSKTVTVEVGASGNGGNFAFSPAAVHVDNGATVEFKWTGKGGGHNVVDQAGEFSSGSPTAEAGVNFKHTFEKDGIYKYFCEPHKSLGMKGAVVVGTDYKTVSTGGGGGGGGGGPTLPGSAKAVGIATTTVMGATLGLAYFFLKYGGDYETPE